MQIKITDAMIHDTVCQVVGEDVIPVVEYLKGRKNISEFKIAEALNEEVNRIRNMLYRLHTHYLVTYIRKKDKLKGWYISYWTLNPNATVTIQNKMKLHQIDQLKERLKREEDNVNGFFICPNLCSRLNLDTSMEYEFKCPECGTLMKQQDNQKTIVRLQARIDELEEELPQNIVRNY